MQTCFAYFMSLLSRGKFVEVCEKSSSDVLLWVWSTAIGGLEETVESKTCIAAWELVESSRDSEGV